MNEELKGKGHNCAVSLSAGEYICNYLYYLSLCEGSVRGIPSLFIHVPPFETQDFEKQVAFVKDVCLLIRKVLVT